HPLSQTFFVIATQNPVESHGAYPLPEAQLDRFAMKLRIGYPDRRSELEMLAANVGATDWVRSDVEAVISPEQLSQLQDHVANVALTPAVQEYLVDLGRATRNHKEITLGLSPRGLIVWQRVSQARAHLRGRDFVTPDDIQDVAGPVLEVRLAGDFDAATRVVDEILASVAVPVFR
ncbi:MAG: MoxR family ATPase, partial [Planctomycetales bacterium]|nr:MoxR family ATPase [Planctomycetales bacterium]